MNILRFILIFIFIQSILTAKSVKIVDEQSLPIPDVRIYTRENIRFTNNLGIVSLDNFNLRDSLTIEKIGYKTRTYTLESIPNIIILGKEAIKLDGFRVSSERIETEEIPLHQKRVISIEYSEANNSSLAEIITKNSNLSLTGRSLKGESQSISISGHKTKHTLILLDGVPQNQSGQEFDLSSIPTEIVDKIEIVEGTAVSLGGAGSFAGLINIKTKHPASTGTQNFKASYTSTYGSFAYWKNSVSLSYNLKDLSAIINLSNLTAENNFEYSYLYNGESEKRQRDNNQKEIRDFNLTLNFINNIVDLKYNLLYQDFIKHLPGPTNQLTKFDEAFLDGTNYKHQLVLRKKIGKIKVQNNFYLHKDNVIYDNTESSLGIYHISTDTDYSKWGDNLNISFERNHWSSSVTGYFKNEKMSYLYKSATGEVIETNSIPEVSQKEYGIRSSINFEQEISVFRFNESLSASYDLTEKDEINTVEDNSSCRIDLSISHNSFIENELGGSISTGYSVPSFYDLYWKGDSQVMGNPDLKTENIISKSVYYQIKFNKGRLKVTIQNDRVENLIYWHRSTLGWKPDNISDAEITNFKLETEIQPLKFFKLSAFWQRTLSEDQTVINGEESSFYGNELIYTPSSQLSITSEAIYKGSTLKLHYSRTGQQYPTRDQLWGALDSFELVDVVVSQKIKIWKLDIDLSLEINNVFDERYQVYSNTPEPGFNWYSAIIIDFIKIGGKK